MSDLISYDWNVSFNAPPTGAGYRYAATVEQFKQVEDDRGNYLMLYFRLAEYPTVCVTAKIFFTQKGLYYLKRFATAFNVLGVLGRIDYDCIVGSRGYVELQQKGQYINAVNFYPDPNLIGAYS